MLYFYLLCTAKHNETLVLSGTSKYYCNTHSSCKLLPFFKTNSALKFLTETFLSVCQSPKTTHLKALPLSTCIPYGNLKVCSIHLLKSRNLLLLQFPEILTQFHCLVYREWSRSKEDTDYLFLLLLDSWSITESQVIFGTAFLSKYVTKRKRKY